ncbi:thiamine pyrophosphate-binding protein [Xenophilus arseniciresistens]|uniref:Thiamine pyrophosphate-binding protein n=1 Tax=Xenophilus arseniciresistens TaxID=1283306 RepID=A0AAE3N9B3_9BURK|nr:thiamine pyrophosphate-binding protein [Xenophilus arseniciresistens]MDA7417333.1 thiamine pyrophosphate-binding protein [Xenophilus arseniciresistens]
MTSKQQVTVGAVVAAFLEQCDVKAAFGVISIHNMPILDAFAQRGKTRFVMARGEAGAGNMADAYARSTSSLGVAITSTGPAAGNIAGSLVEARNAGTPLLHITGQIETQYLDQNLAYIHEAPDQLNMLLAVSKAAFRVRTAETCLSTLKAAVQCALTAPTGPVSVEIPIDIQQSVIDMPADLSPLPVTVAAPTEAALDALADNIAKARRPLLWLGGGARHAGAAVARLKALGFGIVSTVQGRGIVAEDDPASLGAYNIQKPVEAFYQRCDAMLAVGTRLRSNETLKYELKLPRPLYRVDVDAAQSGRCYADDGFVCGDSALVLTGLAERLEKRGYKADAELLADLRKTHDEVTATLHDGLGPYTELVQALQKAAGRQFNWVRDVTLSNSIWGNRELRFFEANAGVHATGGGIGMGMPMAIGAAIGAAETGSGRKTIGLAGDGGFILNLGELATLVQEECDAVIVLMNDQRYGVIRNIQDASYGGRRCYVDLHTPDYEQLCASIKLPHARVQDLKALPGVLDAALAKKGPFLLEIDMQAIGGFKAQFAGPPVNKMDQVPATPKNA